MDEDEFNLSIRKFLKKVGITSQREIEKSIREALSAGTISADSLIDVSVKLSIGHQPQDIVIDGQIKLQ